MDNDRQIQLRTSSDNTPAIPTAESLAAIRMDGDRYPHYRSIPQPKRQEWLAGQMKYLASITRIRDFSAREAILMATVLDEMIVQHRDMSELTFPEIADAFKSGVFGFYGEFYGLSATNLYDYLVSFLDSAKKKEATALVAKSKEAAYLERTKAERDRQRQDIRAEIEEAKRNGSFVTTGKAWFKPKMVNDIMPDNKAHRALVRQQAREILNQARHDTDSRRSE